MSSYGDVAFIRALEKRIAALEAASSPDLTARLATLETRVAMLQGQLNSLRAKLDARSEKVAA